MIKSIIPWTTRTYEILRDDRRLSMVRSSCYYSIIITCDFYSRFEVRTAVLQDPIFRPVDFR